MHPLLTEVTANISQLIECFLAVIGLSLLAATVFVLFTMGDK